MCVTFMSKKSVEERRQGTIVANFKTLFEYYYYAALADVGERDKTFLKPGPRYQTFDNMTAEEIKRHTVVKSRITLGIDAKHCLGRLCSMFTDEFANVQHFPKSHTIEDIHAEIAETCPTADFVFRACVVEWETDGKFDLVEMKNNRLIKQIEDDINKNGKAARQDATNIAAEFDKFVKVLAYRASRINMYNETLSCNHKTICGLFMSLGLDITAADEYMASVPEKPVKEKPAAVAENVAENVTEYPDEGVEYGEDIAAEGEEADGEGEEADGEEVDGEEVDGEAGEEADGEEADGEGEEDETQ